MLTAPFNEARWFPSQRWGSSARTLTQFQIPKTFHLLYKAEILAQLIYTKQTGIEQTLLLTSLPVITLDEPFFPDLTQT